MMPRTAVLCLSVMSIATAALCAGEPALPRVTAPKVAGWPVTGDDLNPPKGKAYVYIQCNLTTKKPSITLGAGGASSKDRDAFPFSDFALILPNKTRVTAAAIGETVGTGRPEFRMAPRGTVAIVSFADKAQVLDVHLLFLVPEKTTEATFQFRKQTGEAVKFPPASSAMK